MLAGLQVKTILNKSKRRDPWFLDDYTINPYSGCSFNCLYCYIRGSKYGEHMEEKTSVKTNALELLDKQLNSRARKGQYGIIVLSSATDPYLHFEETEQLTRRMLQLILQYRFPVHIITKSNLVLRDLDILTEIDKAAILPPDLEGRLAHRAMVTFSFSTVDDTVAKIFEPGATPPSLRLNALKCCVEQNFHTGVSLMPLLPYISDTKEHLDLMFTIFRDIGTRYIFPATITLFGNQPADSRVLVLRAIEKYYPHLLEKYQRFFTTGTEMPVYYRNAFYKKAQELCMQYGIKNTII